MFTTSTGVLPRTVRMGKGSRMSISDESYNNESDEADEQRPSEIKGLRKAAEENPKLKAELNAAKRELAFVKAGIPLEDPKMSYFVKGYDGDLEADAIRQAAVDAGFITIQQQQPDPVQQQAQASQQRVMQASAGVGAAYDPSGVLHGMEQAMAEGGLDGMMEFGQQYGLKISRE